MTQLLTVIVPAGNRLDVIEDCLQSVRWADEVIVVDSFSSDGTLDVARRYADRVLQHEYGFSALQKNWAIPQAANEWVLIVDTDERVPLSLQQEIQAVLEAPSNIAGYKIPRLNLYLGRPLQEASYYPDYQLRLFRRDLGHYDLRHVHAHLILNGECGTLFSPLVHYAHRSVDQTVRNLLVMMTTWEAEQRSGAILSPQPHSAMRFLWFNLIFRPVAAFLLRYFWQGGWREGYHGLTISMLWAMYVGITYMKIWEHSLKLPAQWWSHDWPTRKRLA